MEQTRNMRRKQKRKHNSHLLKLAVLFTLLCFSAWFILNYKLSESSHDIPKRLLIQDYDSTDSPFNTSQDGSRILTFDRLADISSDYLLLINGDYEIPGNISGELVSVIDYARTLNVNLLMDKNALIMLQEMFNDAAKVSYTEFRVTDGYRTHELQQSLYDSAADKTLVALPGYSEHQTGFAADISYHGVNIGNSKQGTWLADNSYKYGFVLRYPQNKESITKIPYEPWHYRYIGQPHAYFCYINDMVLEEYIAYLREHEEITVNFNGIEYWVYYLSDVDEIIKIPENFSYSASLDNTGRIIVTAWISNISKKNTT